MTVHCRNKWSLTLGKSSSAEAPLASGLQ